jgi:hypothetical protein
MQVDFLSFLIIGNIIKEEKPREQGGEPRGGAMCKLD